MTPGYGSRFPGAGNSATPGANDPTSEHPRWRKGATSFPVTGGCADCHATIGVGTPRMWNGVSGGVRRGSATVCMACAEAVGLREGCDVPYRDLKAKMTAPPAASSAAAPPAPPASAAPPAPPAPAAPSAPAPAVTTPPLALPKVSAPTGAPETNDKEVVTTLHVKGGTVIAIAQRDHVSVELVGQKNFQNGGAELTKASLNASGYVPAPGETPEQTQARVAQDMSYAKLLFNAAKATLDEVVSGMVSKPWQNGPLYR